MYQLVKVKPSTSERYNIVMSDAVVGNTTYDEGKGKWYSTIGVYWYESTKRKSSVEGCIRRVVVLNSMAHVTTGIV